LIINLHIVFIQIKGNLKTVNFTASFDYSINSCGGVINGQKITITSPNYPKNYQQNTKCAWLVKLPEGAPVHVSFGAVVMIVFS